MKNTYILIFTLTVILIFLNTFGTEYFYSETNKYNVIFVNHKNYQIIILKNTSNDENKIYKIYKN